MSDYPVLERNPAAISLAECIAGLRWAQPFIATPPERAYLEKVAARAERVLATLAATQEATDKPPMIAQTTQQEEVTP